MATPETNKSTKINSAALKAHLESCTVAELQAFRELGDNELASRRERLEAERAALGMTKAPRKPRADAGQPRVRKAAPALQEAPHGANGAS